MIGLACVAVGVCNTLHLVAPDAPEVDSLT